MVISQLNQAPTGKSNKLTRKPCEKDSTSILHKFSTSGYQFLTIQYRRIGTQAIKIQGIKILPFKNSVGNRQGYQVKHARHRKTINI